MCIEDISMNIVTNKSQGLGLSSLLNTKGHGGITQVIFEEDQINTLVSPPGALFDSRKRFSNF